MTEQTYETLLEFPEQPLSDWTAQSRALERAHTIRMFEIDLYWKRSTYFWILQAAVFAGLGLTVTKELQGNLRLIPLMLGCVGFLAALAGHLSAKGSKFWQQNWEKHIDWLENSLEGKLHKSLWMPNGKVSWSVTGVNNTLTLSFTLFWVAATITVYRQLFSGIWISAISINNIDSLRSSAFAAIVATLAFAMSMLSQKTGKGSDIQSDRYSHLSSQAVLGIRKIGKVTPPA